MYVLLSGSTQLSRSGSPITTLERGSHVGEMSIIGDTPRSATAVTQEPCSLLSLARDDFFELVLEDPIIGSKLLWSLVQVLSDRLRDTNLRVDILQNSSASQGSPFNRS